MAARPDEPGFAQSRKVVGNVVLALAESRGHLADAMGAVGEDPQDPGACPVADQRGGQNRGVHVRRRQVEAWFRKDGQLAADRRHLRPECVTAA